MPLQPISETGRGILITASKLAVQGPGALIGMFVSSATASSKLAFTDGIASAASAGLRMIGLFPTPTTAGFYPIRANFNNGLYVNANGSAQSVTLIIGATP